MFTFDYRQQLMEKISSSCQDRVCLYGEHLAQGEEQARCGYLHIVASDAVQFVRLLAPGTKGKLPDAPDGTPLTAGELYRALFWAASGREARARDCRWLDALQQRLMDAERTLPKRDKS